MQNQRTVTIHDARYENSIRILIRARKESMLSQSELAQKLGFTQPDISKIERLERRLDISEFIDILDVLSNKDKSVFDNIWSEICVCHDKRSSS